MNIKRVLTGSLAAIAAGATLLAAGFAASDSLGDYVVTSDGSLASPILVVGKAAKVDDVISAADIAAAVAGYATTTTSVAGATTTSVTGGTMLDTTNTKLYLEDGLNAAKTTLTKNDLSTLLASGTISVSGVTYSYDQYITMGSRTVTFGNSGESIDPILYVDVGTGGTNVANPLYTTTVVFNKPLNVSNSRVQGKAITLFNKDYTIGSGSDYNTLILYGYGVTTPITHGEETTVSIGGTDYTVKVIIDTSSNVMLYVNGETDGTLYSSGESTTIQGLTIYIKSVLYASSTDLTQNYATLSLGSEKLTLDSGNKVKVGETATSIDGTYVTVTGTAGTGISKLTIATAAEKTTGDYLAAGGAFTDPVFGSFKVAFNGLTPALDSDTRETISLGTSGDNAATLTFTDYRGNEKTVYFAYDNDTSTSTVTPILGDTSARVYHVIEGEAVLENEYVLLSQGDFSHIFQLTDINDIGDSTGTPKIDITDIFSGDVLTIYMEAPGYTNAMAYIDGQTYYVNATSTQVKFTWKANSSDTATYGSAGSIKTLFPLIKTKNGALVTFFNNATSAFGSTSGINYEFPGGSAGTTIATVTNATSSVSAGRLTYYFTPGSSTTTLKNVSGVTFNNHPIVLVLEEKGKNSAGAEVRDAILAKTATIGTAAPYKMGWDSTVTFTDASSPSFTTMVSDTYTKKAVDRYGTYVSVNTYGQVSATIYYPDEQATAAVAVGTDPVFSTTAGGTTVETAVKITEPVSKFDNEIDTTALTGDLILVGGPCVNTLVAELMGTTLDNCLDVWTYTTGIIKEYENAFDSGKKALVVAGTNAADTRSLAAKVMKGTLSFEE
jgi:hypothetical protein